MWGLVNITAQSLVNLPSHLTSGNTYQILWADSSGTIIKDDSGNLFAWDAITNATSWANVLVVAPLATTIQIYP